MLRKLLLAGVLVSGGCASAPVAPAPTACTGVYCGSPAWVRKGSGAFGDDQGKAFHGVGVASNTPMESLRRTTSEAIGRTEMARVMDTYVMILLKLYQESVSNTPGSQDVQTVTNTLKTFTQQELHGAEVVDRWISNDGTAEFALTRLDFGAFSSDMIQVKALNDHAREVIKSRADQAFDELNKEEAKRPGQ